jgi:hypothetical protein
MALVVADLGLAGRAGRSDALIALADHIAADISGHAAVERRLALSVGLTQTGAQAFVVLWAVHVGLAARLDCVKADPIIAKQTLVA